MARLVFLLAAGVARTRALVPLGTAASRRGRAVRAEASDDFDVDAFRQNKAQLANDLATGPITDPFDIGDDMDISHYLGGSQFDPYGASSPGGASKKTEGAGPNYVWQQSTDGMSVAIPVAAGTRARDVSVEWPSPRSVVAAVAGDVLVEGTLKGAVDRDETFWSLEETGDDGMAVVVDVAKAAGSRELWAGFTAAENDPHAAAVTRRCFLDLSIAGAAPRRVVVGLFGEDVPLTAANFLQLCAGVDVEGKTYSYANSTFHRILKDFMIQGGDVTNGDGTGGVSVYGGGAFDDEAFPFSHAGAGVLSMANAGPNSNKSQFFITLGDCEWLDEKHVVFGRVLEGLDVVRDAGNMDTTRMSATVTIVASGVLPDE